MFRRFWVPLWNLTPNGLHEGRSGRRGICSRRFQDCDSREQMLDWRLEQLMNMVWRKA